MMIQQSVCSVAILCGGKGKRMGFDKTELRWQGKSLTEKIAAGFCGCDDVFLSVRDSRQVLPMNLPAVCDEQMGCGPLAGLTASLKNCRHELLFVTTCDPPFVDEAVCCYMLQKLSPEVQAVVPVEENGCLHPLTALYRKNVLTAAEEQLAEGNLRMTALLEKINVKYVPVASFNGGAETFLNLNTKEDIEKLADGTGMMRRADGAADAQCIE